MISTKERIDLLVRLGEYMQSGDEAWLEAKERAKNRNAWFSPLPASTQGGGVDPLTIHIKKPSPLGGDGGGSGRGLEGAIDMAVQGITNRFLEEKLLIDWINSYPAPKQSVKVGIVMAGNIPLVGFHDFLCGFVSGHQLQIKLSSKDDVLLPHLVDKLKEWQPAIAEQVTFSENLKGCDAYIATGSNNTARYFEQYFGKYPNIIRRNRTSVAVLTGNESENDLLQLGTDIFSYYGLGCRNVTKVFLPEGYNVRVLLDGLQPYGDIIHHHKYKHNYDYYLATYLLNKVPYLSNDFLLMVENKEPFSAVSVLHYGFYADKEELLRSLQADDNIQCIVDNVNIPYGQSQFPALSDYADGIDTMMFLSAL